MSFHMHYRSIHLTEVLCLLLSLLLAKSSIADSSVVERTYPRRVWQTKKPSEAGFNSEKIDAIARFLEG